MSLWQERVTRDLASRAAGILDKARGTVAGPTVSVEQVDLHQPGPDSFALTVKLTALLMHRGLADRMRALVEAFHEQAGALSESLPRLGKALTENGVSMANDLAETQRHVSNFFKFSAKSSFSSTFVDHLSALTGVSMDVSTAEKNATDTEEMLALSTLLRRVAVEVSKLSAELQTLNSRGRSESDDFAHRLVSQLAFQVVGQDLGATMSVVLPDSTGDVCAVGRAMLNNLQLLELSVGLLRDQLMGLEVTRLHNNYVEMTVEEAIQAATRLIPIIGYESSCDVAKTALAGNKSVQTVAVELGHCTADQIAALGTAPKTTEGTPELAADLLNISPSSRNDQKCSPNSHCSGFKQQSGVSQAQAEARMFREKLEKHIDREGVESPPVSTPSDTAVRDGSRDNLVAGRVLPPVSARSASTYVKGADSEHISTSSSMEELTQLTARPFPEARKQSRRRRSRTKTKSPTAQDLAPLKKTGSLSEITHSAASRYGMRRAHSEIFEGPNSPADHGIVGTVRPHRSRSFTSRSQSSSPTSYLGHRSPSGSAGFEGARAVVAATLLRERLPLPASLASMRTSAQPHVPIPSPGVPTPIAAEDSMREPLIARWNEGPADTVAGFDTSPKSRAL
eukprot:COSAG02_NODE_4612_length_5167_cov_52.768153_3_plen_624_part_00